MNLLLSREFLNKLLTNSNLLGQFQSSKSNTERLEILRNHLELNEPGFLQNLQRINQIKIKDSNQSLQTKKEGIQHFADKRCYEALSKTNESLSLAPPHCDFLPHLFGNRSAILFELGNFDDAIVNIDIALAQTAPELFKLKLLCRKAKCLKHLDLKEADSVYTECLKQMETQVARLDENNGDLKQYKELKRNFERSWKDLCVKPNIDKNTNKSNSTDNTKYTKCDNGKPRFDFNLIRKNERIPVASSQITLSTNAEFGRGVYAAEDISPGELIVVENPSATVLHPGKELRLTHCHHCLRRNPSCLVPCEGCDVLFCNENCKQESYRTSHRTECRVLFMMNQLSLFGIVEMLALRFILQETKQGSDIGEVLAKISASELKEKEFYETLAFQLETNEGGREPKDLVARIFKSLVLCQLLRLNNFFPGGDNNTSVAFGSEVSTFGSLLVHYFQVVACNAHDINVFFTSPDCPNGDQIQIGSGLYSFCSMFNHSCDPSVVRHSIDGPTMIVTTIKAVEKGDQLFDNYGCHYATHERTYRVNYLKDQYRFHCTCEACGKDFPLFRLAAEERGFTFRDDVIVTKGARVELVQSSENFNQILADLFANGLRRCDATAKLVAVKRHMDLLNQCVVRPHQEFEKCQETYKRILCYLTNCSVLEEGEKIPD